MPDNKKKTFLEKLNESSPLEKQSIPPNRFDRVKQWIEQGRKFEKEELPKSILDANTDEKNDKKKTV